jgi:hypothetical protein
VVAYAGSLAPRGERVRVRDICAARLSDAPHILKSTLSSCTRLFKSIGDALHNSFDLRSDLMVPKSQQLVSCVAQKLSAILVCDQFVGVLRTVDLNNQPCLWAKEIHEEWTDGVLTAELESIELAAAQARPESMLPFGLFTPWSTGGIANQCLDDISCAGVERSARQAIAPNGGPSPKPAPHVGRANQKALFRQTSHYCAPDLSTWPGK